MQILAVIGVGALMLAGTIVSALIGGLAGVAFSVTRELGLLQLLLSYQIGGLVAVMAFIATLHSAPSRQEERAD